VQDSAVATVRPRSAKPAATTSSDDEAPKPARRRAKPAASDEEAPKPKRARRRAPSSESAPGNGAPNPLEAASERVRAAVREASETPAGDEVS
jgi:hypothetical protein